MRKWLADEIGQYPRLAVLGDYNVAPADEDVHNPEKWEGQVLVSEPERNAFRALLDLGLTDSFRLFPQPEKSFSWWDYRQFGFPQCRPAHRPCAAVGAAGQALRGLRHRQGTAPQRTTLGPRAGDRHAVLRIKFPAFLHSAGIFLYSFGLA